MMEDMLLTLKEIICSVAVECFIAVECPVAVECSVAVECFIAVECSVAVECYVAVECLPVPILLWQRNNTTTVLLDIIENVLNGTTRMKAQVSNHSDTNANIIASLFDIESNLLG
jgi:hypothetical protein